MNPYRKDGRETEKWTMTARQQAACVALTVPVSVGLAAYGIAEGMAWLGAGALTLAVITLLIVAGILP